MAISFRLHTFHVDSESFVANHFPERHAVSVFRERDGQFIAGYVLDPGVQTPHRAAGYWQSIHTDTGLSLLSRLEPAVADLPLEQPETLEANSTDREDSE